MAGIDLLPGAGSAVPSGKPVKNDAASDPTRSGADSGTTGFGSVLSDTMRPASRKDNTSSGRDQDSSPSPSSRGTNSSSQPSSQSPTPTSKSGSRTDPRRSSDKGKADSADPGPAPENDQTTTPAAENQAPTDSASTIEKEVADVQKDEQQTSADAANGEAPVQPGVAPAQLVAGLLIATTQTPPQNAPGPVNATPQNGPTPAQAAIANVQKAPAGLASALEQAATAGTQDASQSAGDDSQPVPAAIHSTQVGADDVVPSQPATNPAGNQPAVNVASGAQAPPVAAAESQIKPAKDTRTQASDDAADDAQPASSLAGTGSDVQSTRPTEKAPSNGASTKPAPEPAVDASAVSTPAPQTPPPTEVKATPDSTRQKSDQDKQQGGTSTLGLGTDAPQKDTGIQVDLAGQSLTSDTEAGNAKGASNPTSALTEQVPPHAKEHDSQPSSDPTGAVTGFAPDNTPRRADGAPAIGATSERSVNPAQVVDQVAHGIQLTHQSGERMQIHLRPPELGNLQIDVSMRDGMLSARLEAQTPSTHQLLLDNLPQLKDSLTQQGLQVDRLEVDLSDSMRNDTSAGGFSQQSFAQQQQNEHLDGVWDPLPNGAAPQRRTQSAESRVTTTRSASGAMLSLDITV